MVLQDGPGASHNQVISSRRNNWSGQVSAAVAQQAGCTLISLDHEHLTRLGSIVIVRTPTAVLAELVSPTSPPFRLVTHRPVYFCGPQRLAFMSHEITRHGYHLTTIFRPDHVNVYEWTKSVGGLEKGSRRLTCCAFIPLRSRCFPRLSSNDQITSIQGEKAP